MGKRHYDQDYDDTPATLPTAQMPMEPLRLPGAVQRLMQAFLPAMSERQATDVMTLGELRNELGAWVAFGVKKDVLQEYLDTLAQNGYVLQNTTSGPALCLIRRDTPSVIRVEGNVL